ncbi:MAG: AAA family ATPase [Zetaproteobacteria bacterium]|nr:AAA family ATPase [Zetaproteobacteria bacterium]
MISRNLEQSLTRAVQIAQSKQHEYISLEHVLLALLENPEARHALLAVGGSLEQTRKDLEDYMVMRLRSSKHVSEKNAPQPTVAFQRVLQNAVQQVIGAGKEEIDGAHVLVALFHETESYALYFLRKQDVTRLDLLEYISHGTIKEGVDPALLEQESHLPSQVMRRDNMEPEEGETSSLRSKGARRALPEGGTGTSSSKTSDTGAGRSARSSQSGSSPLAIYTVDLCAKAEKGMVDPLIGREHEVDRAIQVLCRRRKNNPLLVGEAGVGKTAIAEGLALRITQGKVPSVLSHARIYALDLGTLVAGTKFRGDFEQRLKGLVREIKEKRGAVLFIDEIHTIMGAGAVGNGSMDVSNILKPSLASGDIRCIGSTTFREYRQHIEKDHALTRRFQKIVVEEPSVKQTVGILEGLKERYEKFHGVRFSRDALKQAAELAHVHIADRKLPDKAIDVIDEAGAFKVCNGFEGSGEPVIGVGDIKRTIAKMAHIPEQRLNQSARHALKNLGQRLKLQIYGQDGAVAALEKAIILAKSGLGRENAPIGSFLFAGPTGVGKTELAKQLAVELGIHFSRLDMSEYMERHAVSRLIGAPPGYVGHEEGGLLTDEVYRNPHSVLLLDEIEKAHSDVHNILLQVMDDGTLTDSNGRKSDFRNVILIMTTNAGAEEMGRGAIGFGGNLLAGVVDKSNEALKKAFSPEFRNRLDAAVSFAPLPHGVMIQIVDKFLARLVAKLSKRKITMQVTQDVREYLAAKGYDPVNGARPMERLLQDEIARPIAELMIANKPSAKRRVVAVTLAAPNTPPQVEWGALA